MAPNDIDKTLGDALIGCARNEIATMLGVSIQPLRPSAAGHPGLAADGATFVTLRRDGKLRGCVGTLNAHRSLEADVRSNAVGAALRDPRFSPLSHEEFHSTRIEVSLLGPSEPLGARSEAEALAAVVPFADGIILEWGGRRATFLPQVWESLPRPRDFLRELRRKAGLPANFWSDEIVLSRYRVAKWKEQAPGVAGGLGVAA